MPDLRGFFIKKHRLPAAERMNPDGSGAGEKRKIRTKKEVSPDCNIHSHNQGLLL